MMSMGSATSFAGSRSGNFGGRLKSEEEQKGKNHTELEPYSFLTNVSGQKLNDAAISTESRSNSKYSNIDATAIDTESLAKQLNILRPSSIKDLMLLPDFKLDPLAISDKMLPAKYSQVKQ